MTSHDLVTLYPHLSPARLQRKLAVLQGPDDARCPVCEEIFTRQPHGLHPRIYCSDRCRTEAKNERKRR